MWATWYGGSLSLPELESSLDLEGVAMDLEGSLPPVIMDSEDPSDDGLIRVWRFPGASAALSAGELGTIPITFYLSAFVGFDMDFDVSSSTRSRSRPLKT